MRVSLEVDLDTIMDELDDSIIFDEARQRGMTPGSLDDVLGALYAGNVQEAICLLEQSRGNYSIPLSTYRDVRNGTHPFLTLAKQ